jgi:hypothetical protein
VGVPGELVRGRRAIKRTAELATKVRDVQLAALVKAVPLGEWMLAT